MSDPDPGPGPVPASPTPTANPLAIGSVIVGVAAVIIVLWVSIVIGAILGFVAIGLGGYARGQAKTKGGAPVAIAGMILGWVAVGLQIYATFVD